MRNLKFLWTVLAVVLATSCAIEMNMFVHEDYTGEMEVKIDISEMMSFMSSMDSLSQPQKDSILQLMNPESEITDKDRAVLAESGLSGMVFSVDEDYISVEYDFEDINNAYDLFFVLDSSTTEDERRALMEAENFIVEKDRLTIRFTDDGMSEMLSKGMGGSDEEDGSGNEEDMFGEEDLDMNFMLNLFTLKQSFSFARPVAGVVDNGLPVSVQDNRINFAVSFSEYMDEFVGKEIVVVFESGKKKKRR
jgi:hypothetical protein